MRDTISQKIEELRELAERIRIIYNPPREYFTIVLPVILAILLIVWAVLAGFTFMGTEKQQQAGGSDTRLQQLKELEAQTGEGESGGSASADNTATARQQQPPRRWASMRS